MNELPELVFQCVQDCNDLDAISIGYNCVDAILR